jgi:NADPH:quinone reductase-like Zn-dependent oxidoreductase
VGQEYLYSVENLQVFSQLYVHLLDAASSDMSLNLCEYSVSVVQNGGSVRAQVTADPPIPNSQRAVVSTHSGGLKLANDIPVPKLEAETALVKVEAVALNPVDWKLNEFSCCPGSISGADFCGTVTAMGNAVQKRLAVGDRVCGWVFGSNPAEPLNGAFAGYVAARGGLVMKVPVWMSSEDASTVALGAATAGQALYQSLGLPLPTAIAMGPSYVLVYGGSTATGTMAIQLLRL